MDVRVRDRAVVLGETLVVADLHLGRGTSSAVEVPLDDGGDVRERLSGLLEHFEPETVVVAGDVLHAFDSLPSGVADELAAIEAAVREAGATLHLLRGNHDTMLGQAWDGPIADTHWLDEDTVVAHGHDDPGVDAAHYVLGHDHPTIEIEGQRHPCVLHGDGGPGGATVTVLPAFTRLAAGVAVNGMDAADFDSPLVTDADALCPHVFDGSAGEALEFPPLGQFRHRL